MEYKKIGTELQIVTMVERSENYSKKDIEQQLNQLEQQKENIQKDIEKFSLMLQKCKDLEIE